jgi:hypothetical protein
MLVKIVWIDGGTNMVTLPIDTPLLGFISNIESLASIDYLEILSVSYSN